MEYLDKQTLRIHFNRSVDRLYVSSQDDLPVLEGMASHYPYCQAIHLLLSNTSESKATLASLYMPQRSILYSFLHYPEELDRSFTVGEVNVQASEEDERYKFQEELERIKQEVANQQEILQSKFPTIQEELPSIVSGEETKNIDTSVSDYFQNPESIVEKNEPKQEPDILQPIEPEYKSEPEVLVDSNDKTDMSKYHDDTMPYTFLWWLHKTRQEYSETRPYAKDKAPTNVGFSYPYSVSQSVGASASLANNKDPNSIIDRFIQNSPQIQAKTNSIDAEIEDKARRSADDTSEFVSETLAKIYIEQMHYAKAIDVYKKISLKFPEKSAYFASIIGDIESKLVKLSK